jgi:hypothetical protein
MPTFSSIGFRWIIGLGITLPDGFAGQIFSVRNKRKNKLANRRSAVGCIKASMHPIRAEVNNALSIFQRTGKLDRERKSSIKD